MYLFIGVILFMAALVFNLLRDYSKILSKEKINHNHGAFVKAVSLLPCILFFALHTEGKWIWALLFSWFMACAWFWLLFDIGLNWARGYDIWFTGSEDGKDDAKTDNVLQGLKTWQHIALKVFLIGLSTYIYIQLL